MNKKFNSLNQYRKGPYKKDEKEENFLQEFNEHLLKKEIHEYGDYPVDHPFIFVIGLPRSGTTLLSQLIAHTFNISYINNLAARFFLAPLHGIKFSKTVLGDKGRSDFHSDYARTKGLDEIHEFGYFWRYWLNKHTFEDITHAKERESRIDWEGVRRVLSSLQHETGKPFVFKNIYGSYHMKKFVEILDKVIFIFIQRDELDTAVSILNARKKYNQDLNVWWSYQPPEYNKIKDLDYWSQIAGQIHYLKNFYLREMKMLPEKSQLQISYKEMCERPQVVIDKIIEKCGKHDGYNIAVENDPPEYFPFRQYQNAEKEKRIFSEKLNEFRNSS